MVENRAWAGGAVKSMATDTNTYDVVEIQMCLESIVCDTKITYIMFFFCFGLISTLHNIVVALK